ncbi:MAG: hypothetical protein ACREOE_09710, partial [Gemmatimonadales bacterium]
MPEPGQGGVVQPPGEAGSEPRLGQQAGDVRQRGARLTQRGERGDTEHVVGARSPVGLEEAV